jgi:hypothetical protein
MKSSYHSLSTLKRKNNVITYLMASAMLLAAVILVQSCKEDPPEKEEKNKPVINSVTPVSAEVGGSITINGQYFSSVPSENIVKISDEIANVSEATETALKVTVPDEAPVGPATIVVTTNGLISSTYNGFTVSETLPELKIDSYTEEGTYGDVITINGSGFVDESKVIVTINGVLQDSALTVTDTKITFILKEKTFSGDFILNRAGTEEILCSFVNHVQFEVEDFNNDIGALWMEFNTTNDELYVVTYLDSKRCLLKLDKQGNITDSLLYDAEGVYPSGLFVNEEGVLYIIDEFGRILYLPKNASDVDTLVKRNADPNIAYGSLYDLTGDNNDNLYFTTNVSETVFKLNTSNLLSDSIFSATSTAKWINFYNDSLFVTLPYAIIRSNTEGSDIKEIYTSERGLGNSQVFFHEQLGLLSINILDDGDLCVIENNQAVQLVSGIKMGLSGCYSVAQTKGGNLLIGGKDKTVKVVIR